MFQTPLIQVGERFRRALAQALRDQGAAPLALRAGLETAGLEALLAAPEPPSLETQANLAAAAGYTYEDFLLLGRRLLAGEGPRAQRPAPEWQGPLERLLHVASSFRLAESHKDLCQRICQALVHQVGFRRAMLFLRQGERLIPCSVCWPEGDQEGLAQALEAHPPRLEDASQVYESFALGRSLPVLPGSDEFFPPPVEELLLGRSEIGLAPLMGDQEFLGVVAADHVLETGEGLREDELSLLEALATLAGAQLANQRLYAQLEEKNRDLEFHVRELTVVGELTRILNRAKEPEAVAQQMLWLLADTLGADYGFMFLYQAKDHSLSLVGSHGLERQRQDDWTLINDVAGPDLLALGGQYPDGAQAGLDRLLPGLEGPVILRDLSNRQRPVGIWGLGRRDAARPFQAEDEKLLATADEQILVALTSLRLRLVAATDYLTGLFTRAKFVSALEREISSAIYLGQPLSLLILDVDHFKDINDTHGHLAGDQVLADLGQVLKSSTRQGDICARIGGEEFAVLLPAADLPRALAAAEKLRLRVRQKVTHHRGQDLAITVSLGVAVMQPGQPLEPDELVRRADQALYQAKRGGRDRVDGYFSGSCQVSWGSLD